MYVHMRFKEERKRGFASLSPERRREVARQGGRTAHANGTAHQWTSEEARQAGRKGAAVIAKRKQIEAEVARVEKAFATVEKREAAYRARFGAIPSVTERSL